VNESDNAETEIAQTTGTPAAPEAAPPPGREPKRRATFVLSELEKRLLVWIAGRLPRFLLPDHMTLIGLAGSALIAFSYLMSNRAPWWLWLASLGFAINWFGDSLDGTLARVRRIQRPRYGFYLDHLTDAFTTLAIGIGLGLSPYMLLAVGLAIVIGYLVLSINVYLESQVLGDFRFGYGVVGPTETRLILIGLNTVAVLVGPIPYRVFGVEATIFDIAGLVGVGGMILMLSRRVIRNLRNLGRLEPPNTVREDQD
jgi:archaetidylinositol phosphate synthase